MRADRLLTMSVVRPWRNLGLRAREQRIPVLMYHSISADGDEKEHAYFRTTTKPEIFGRQMELLRAGGYRATGLTHARQLLSENGSAAGNKLVAITFDDGFRDFHANALPVLVKHGFSATMYLPTAFVGGPARKFKERECMTWEEVRECRRAGVEFGSHTVNHPKLYEMGFDKICAELSDSKTEIERQLGEVITAFAYPFAFPSADVSFVKKFVELLQAAGYQSNVTTTIGRMGAGDNPFTIRRLPVNSADDDAFFMAKLRGSYDWMNGPQSFVKKIKSFASGPRVAARATAILPQTTG
jgi:peptidoglycan/xylan/chitin deacetylase (PgdA/CDA1 family)